MGCRWDNGLPISVQLWYTTVKELIVMTVKKLNRRLAAVKTADAINAIEGAPISAYARSLSASWARGEITGEQMRAALLASHKKLAAQVSGNG